MIHMLGRFPEVYLRHHKYQCWGKVSLLNLKASWPVDLREDFQLVCTNCQSHGKAVFGLYHLRPTGGEIIWVNVFSKFLAFRKLNRQAESFDRSSFSDVLIFCIHIPGEKLERAILLPPVVWSGQIQKLFYRVMNYLCGSGLIFLKYSVQISIKAMTFSLSCELKASSKHNYSMSMAWG